ncbi:hypothetical protein [Aneurinibacillus migulanus]|uniref:DNA polymerase III beta subunit, C-terminal domain n=1 Tax=Aneurinibacillus migulanus TaxID=47500 RepID=A0A0D1YF26_ANEMI|nr:hypothetical protein [Aneurinibacillus migulanus]KIV57522.1 hypothetical protein TS65_09890 [Aneurinibacillus migulanus]KON94861.1 hypothetical protein AF333_04535 [Aneurinibacillus migulanus]MED0892877.1 hypothetical protein [Aneurinibacillus migulanus]MED1619123.1 hypothetical protein [Aneurinibacillus migulanus]SDI91813.1 DNA polymerase III beta subunit, C-terminal domain [Aneurinibacillus migulanus]
MELIHSDKYGIALDIAKKFTGAKEYRVILHFVQHTADGHLVATDTHKLIKIMNVHGFEEERLINPRSYEMAKGIYPNVNGIIPTDTKDHILLDKDQINVWYQAHKSMAQMLKNLKVRYSKATRLSFNDDSFHFTAMLGKDAGINFELPYTEYVKPEQPSTTYNIEYMRDALEAHIKMGSESVVLQFTGQMSPFLVTNEKDVLVLILPIRTPQ